MAFIKKETRERKKSSQWTMATPTILYPHCFHSNSNQTMCVPNLCLVFILLLLSSKARILRCQNLSCNSDDLKALHGFLSGISGWDISNTSDCCSWTGVTCHNFSRFGLKNSSDTRVVGLDLSQQRLSGKILEPLADFDQLRILNLSHNLLEGHIPTNLFHMQKLEVLDLSSNQFTGSMPADTNLPSIQFFNISKNYISGLIPENLCTPSTRVQVLDLSANDFIGELPSSLGNCRSLQHLSLAGNALSGSLPDSLFRLVELDVSYNLFSGNLPDVFWADGMLEKFSAASNNFTGVLPTSLVNSPSLLVLNLKNNSLVGPINLNCSAMIRLVYLDLGSNHFNGLTLANQSPCQRLRSLNLARNNLGNDILHIFKNLGALKHLSVTKTGLQNISLALGALQHCKNLTTLVLTGNFYGEEMPSNLSLEFKSMKTFVLGSSQLKGLIPQWLRGLSKLQLLDLSWNCLSGTIPFWLGKYEFLIYLDISNNSFTGEIPRSLTKLPSLMQNTVLEESSPDFPFFSSRNLSIKGYQYNQIYSLPPTVDLSFNMLTGPIWTEFGNLKVLHILNLKMNNLSGPIPEKLSEMTSLEILDLSHNNLSGSIPMLLESLHFLSKFSVAYNQLYGLIPPEGQFSTFSCSSFEGNKGLCGKFCFRCPTQQHPPQEIPPEPTIKENTIIGLPFGVGATTGFILTVTFCFMSGWVLPKPAKRKRRGYIRWSK